MSWMKAVFTDVEELNEKVLDIYSQGEITSPWDAVDPIADYLTETGWKTPTEMLAMRRDITARLHAIMMAAGTDSTATNALVLHLIDLFKIDVADVVVPDDAASLPEAAGLKL